MPMRDAADASERRIHLDNSEEMESVLRTALASGPMLRPHIGWSRDVQPTPPRPS